MKRKIQAMVLEEIVSKEIRLYTESFLEKEQARITSQKVRESICESLLERKKKAGSGTTKESNFQNAVLRKA